MSFVDICLWEQQMIGIFCSSFTKVSFYKIFVQIGLWCGGAGMNIKRWEGVKHVGSLQRNL
jgi:hypothetical protein